MTNKQTVLVEKIQDRIKMNRPRVERFLDQLQSDNNGLSDTIVKSDQFSFDEVDQNIVMNFGDRSAALGKFATKQIATRLGVPTNYVHKLNGSDWGTRLAAHALNEHAKNRDPQKVLIRQIDGQVRGVLSDQYKRLNSLVIFRAFIESALAQGAQIYDATIDETKSYIDVLSPKVYTIETPKNGVIDVVFGAETRKSDFGDGALNIRTYYKNLVCLNGMIGQSFLNEIHRGSRMPDNIRLSDKTYKLETDATASLVNDAISSIFDQQNIQREVNRIIKASNQEIKPDKKIETLKKTKHFSDFEIQSIKNRIMAGNPDHGVQGADTTWKLVQAVTSVANEFTTTRRNELIEYANELY